MGNAQKLFDEVTSLFRKGEEIAADGTVLRKITGNNVKKIMEEFTQDGALTRKSIFVNNVLENVQDSIEEFVGGPVKRARKIEFKDGKPSWYEEGYEELANGLRKRARTYQLNNKGWQQISK